MKIQKKIEKKIEKVMLEHDMNYTLNPDTDLKYAIYKVECGIEATMDIPILTDLFLPRNLAMLMFLQEQEG